MQQERSSQLYRASQETFTDTKKLSVRTTRIVRKKRAIEDIWKYMENTVKTISPKCACGGYFESCQATITVTVVKTASVISPPRVSTQRQTLIRLDACRDLSRSPKIQILSSELIVVFYSTLKFFSKYANNRNIY